MDNKNLQIIYTYLTNDVADDEIRELIIYLRNYIHDGSWIDFELTEEDYNNFKSIVALFN